ncbi:hypothetical protein [Pseudoxanthomonas jiangsuensis]|uniref:hypothetical protein n=1 Tax=Pseudoxanthomonas jiangsuensis TaxID=619688 RepID=UPI001390C74D|nr:hypothetical protein [Pseudoxanthomonas jiangsuensis]
MLVELKHHYGWEQYEVDAETIEEAAYKAVRTSHHFLNDTNHTYTSGDRVLKLGGQEHHFKSVLVYRAVGAPAYSGPRWGETDYWFAVEYRAPIGQGKAS